MRADALSFTPALESDAVDVNQMRADAIAFTPVKEGDAADTMHVSISAAAVAAAARMQQKDEAAVAAVRGGVAPTGMELWTQSCEYAWQCAAAAAADTAWDVGADDDFCSTAAPSPDLAAGDNPPPWASPLWGYDAEAGPDFDISGLDAATVAAAAAAAWCAEHVPDMEVFALPEVDQCHEYVMDGLEDPMEYAKTIVTGVRPETYYEGGVDADSASALVEWPPGLEPPPGLDLNCVIDVPPGLETWPEGIYADGASVDEKQEELDDATVDVSSAATDPGLPAGCTTVMLRNIPNKYTQEKLMVRLRNGGYGRDVDFLYLPVDFKNKCNVGYVFVNFRTDEACLKFYNEFHQASSVEKLPGFKSKKICEVSPARCQGLEENTKRLQSSPVMLELARTPEWLPMIFDSDGHPLEFPVPDSVRAQTSLASGESRGDDGGGAGAVRRSRASRRSRAQ